MKKKCGGGVKIVISNYIVFELDEGTYHSKFRNVDDLEYNNISARHIITILNLFFMISLENS